MSAGAAPCVLFATAYFPPYAPGGAEHSTEALVRALRERGTAVTVATPALGPLEPALAGVVRFPVGVTARDPLSPVRSRAFLRPDVQLRLAAGYRRAIRETGATLVHCQHLVALPAAYLAARLARVPLVVTVRDLSAVCPLAVCLLERPRVPGDCGQVRLHRRCVREYCAAYGTRRARTHLSSAVGLAVSRLRAWLLRRADARIFVGSDLAELHRDAGLIAARDRVHVTGNIAVDGHPPAPGAREDGAYALVAGKVSVGKGAGLLLEAAPRMRARCPDLEVVVLGRADPVWRTRLEAAEGIEYRGVVDRSEVLAAYRGARLAVVPSVWPEPLPRAVLEAQAAGVPVVATNVGGVPDAVSDDESGVLVRPADPDALADAVARLWTDEPRRARLARGGHAAVTSRFSADAVCARTLAAYREAALNHRRRSDR